MTPSELAGRITDYVEQTDWVSQGELIARFGDDLRGDLSIEFGDTNITLFVGCSSLFHDALRIMQQERRIHIAPMSVIALAIDNTPIPNMPIARRFPPKGYKTPHFACVGFRPAEKVDCVRKLKVDR